MRKFPKTAVNLVAMLATVSGLCKAMRRIRRGRTGFRVFILEYHGVSESGLECEGTVSQDRLRGHLRFLTQRFPITTLAEAADLLNGERPLSEDTMVISFDDGYANNFTAAWPVLRQESVPATIFLTTGFLDGMPLWFDVARRKLEAIHRQGGDQPQELVQILPTREVEWSARFWVNRMVNRLKYMPEEERHACVAALDHFESSAAEAQPAMLWSQVRQMQQNGIEMGGHTVSHPILSTLPPERQEEEILGCWNRIKEASGVAPTTFAYPNGSIGDYDRSTLEILEASGFRAATTTRRGSNRPGCNPYTLRRIGVGSDSNWLLSARISGLFDDEIRRRLSYLR